MKLKRIKAFACPYCGKRFTSLAGLNTHLGKIHKELKIKIEVCEKLRAYQRRKLL